MSGSVHSAGAREENEGGTYTFPPVDHAREQGRTAAEAAALATRYSRQVLFRPIGQDGQKRLGQAHAAVVGVGATGAATAQLLARAGVGRLTLIDRDFVEPSNLQRQVLFDEADALEALPKAEAARRHLGRINSDVEVRAEVADLVPGNIATLLGGADLLLDCTDNFETRYLLNDFSVSTGTPWIYAGAVGAYAAGMNVLPERKGAAGPTACLACLFPAAPSGNVETCDTAGVLSTAVNLAASWQTTEALKLLSGHPEAMRRTFVSFDLWTGEQAKLNASRPVEGCAVCGKREFRYLAGEARPHITLCGRNAVQIHEHDRPVDLAALRARLEPLGTVRANSMLLRFTYGEHTLSVFPDGRALVQGTTDPGIARALYARFVGA